MKNLSSTSFSRVVSLITVAFFWLLASPAFAEGSGDKVIGLNATGIAGIEQWGVTLNAKHITLRNPTDGTAFDIQSLFLGFQILSYTVANGS